MSFGFSLRRWDDAFEEDELSAVRAFVQRVDPTQSWEALLQAKPPGLGFGLWSELGHYWDSLLTRYGVVAHYEAVQLLPVHLSPAG